jgi:hypothetical protein
VKAPATVVPQRQGIDYPGERGPISTIFLGYFPQRLDAVISRVLAPNRNFYPEMMQGSAFARIAIPALAMAAVVSLLAAEGQGRLEPAAFRGRT